MTTTMETDHWIVVQNVWDIGFRRVNRAPYRKPRVEVMILKLPRDTKYRNGDLDAMIDHYIGTGNLIGIKDMLINSAFFDDDPGFPLDASVRSIASAPGYIEEMKELYSVLPEHIVIEERDFALIFRE